MKPIINPIWFYLVNIVDSLKDFVCILAVIIVATLLIAGVISIIDEDFEIIKKYFRKLAVAAIIISTLAIVIPDKSTCYQMMIASQITPNNIEIVQGEVKNLIDYIVDAADKLNNKEEDSNNSDK